jgi:hypothetical protein
MPELPVKEVRMPELHLPEITREEIVRTLSEVRPPDFELPRVERTTIEIGDVEIPAFKLRGSDGGRLSIPRLELPAIDLSKLFATAIATVGLGRPRISRSRWGLAALGIAAVAGIVAVIVARNEAARERVATVARDVGGRVDDLRTQATERLGMGADSSTDPVTADMDAYGAVDATDTTMVVAEPNAVIETETNGASDRMPAFEETSSPA